MSLPFHQALPLRLSTGTTLAHNVLIARVARDWTQHRLAEASGVSRATIAQLEAGAGDPRLSTVELIATALGVTAALLLFGDVEIDTVMQVAAPSARAPIFSPAQLESLTYLVASNRPAYRLDAARTGIAAALEAGWSHPTALIGAGIATYRRPGPAAAVFAQLASNLRPKSAEPNRLPHLREEAQP